LLITEREGKRFVPLSLLFLFRKIQQEDPRSAVHTIIIREKHDGMHTAQTGKYAVIGFGPLAENQNQIITMNRIKSSQ